MNLIHSLSYPPPSPNTNPNPKIHGPSSPHPRLLLRFRPSRRQTILYLKTLGIDAAAASPESLDWTLSIVEFLKSKGFDDPHFPRLASFCPRIFSSSTDVHRTLAPVLSFLVSDLSASPDQARELIIRCPELLTSNVDYRLQPTLDFLEGLGIKNLSTPSNLNAHLLNTPVEKLLAKIGFFEGLGFSYEESAGMCARCPAIFGYGVESNLRPKIEYLVYMMRRPLEEVKEFPQYFAFSLKKRIAPRHLHLKERGIRIHLRKMLFYGDEKFYAKWK
ncbi:hypothetical protein J5N97_024711 [Dioscorea zingiberensis]|uniref:Uncharacterized protein n=1 Tax=Dioscorea zingiberensis TaxID=325984 RepID=A0A9D5C7G5_9LILI|nr:hypothetical protein J5N97_024711 [Dioscorea zingiberensis]